MLWLCHTFSWCFDNVKTGCLVAGLQPFVHYIQHTGYGPQDSIMAAASASDSAEVTTDAAAARVLPLGELGGGEEGAGTGVGAGVPGH